MPSTWLASPTSPITPVMNAPKANSETPLVLTDINRRGRLLSFTTATSRVANAVMQAAITVGSTTTSRRRGYSDAVAISSPAACPRLPQRACAISVRRAAVRAVARASPPLMPPGSRGRFKPFGIRCTPSRLARGRPSPSVAVRGRARSPKFSTISALKSARLPRAREGKRPMPWWLTTLGLVVFWAAWHLRRRYHVTSWRTESGDIEVARCQECWEPAPLAAETRCCQICERKAWMGVFTGLLAGAILFVVFVGPVVATGILAGWLTDGNYAAEVLGAGGAALGVALIARRQCRRGRWPWGPRPAAGKSN